MLYVLEARRNVQMEILVASLPVVSGAAVQYQMLFAVVTICTAVLKGIPVMSLLALVVEAMKK